MLRELLKRFEAGPIVCPTRDEAEHLADIHRDIDPAVDFAVRAGRGGWMIARLRKSGVFHSWVE